MHCADGGLYSCSSLGDNLHPGESVRGAQASCCTRSLLDSNVHTSLTSESPTFLPLSPHIIILRSLAASPPTPLTATLHPPINLPHSPFPLSGHATPPAPSSRSSHNKYTRHVLHRVILASGFGYRWINAHRPLSRCCSAARRLTGRRVPLRRLWMRVHHIVLPQLSPRDLGMCRCTEFYTWAWNGTSTVSAFCLWAIFCVCLSAY